MSNKKKSTKKTRREQIREKRRRSQQRKTIATTLSITGIALILVAILIFPRLKPVGKIVEITPRTDVQMEGKTLGSSDAPVVMEVFEDFQCPACRNFTENIEPQLIENYVKTGKVMIVYRQFPFIGPESLQAANASMCAQEQDRFWDYHDILFANQTGENIGAFTTRRLQAFAETLGLDTGAFNDCLRKNSYQTLIAQDQQKGRDYGISSTPTIVVNGVPLPPSSYNDIAQAIDLALAGQ